MSELYSRIRQRAQEFEPDITRFLARMIETPAFSGQEAAVIAVVEEEMRAVGFDEVRIDALGSIVGRMGDGPRTIAFDAHVDTVLAGDESLWSTPPFSAVIEDGVIRGRGSVDQEGGLAAMVHAARIIRELGLDEGFTLLFTGTVMEEDCEGLCWRHLIEEDGLRPELVVITEPTNLGIYRGQRGRMEMDVHVGGVSCHGSAPERGDNAIYKAARIALEIEELNVRLADDPFLGKGTVTVTQATSSSPSLCAVPDGASIHLDRRLTAGETKESAVAEVRDAAARAGYPDAKVEVSQYEGAAYTGRTYAMEKYCPTWTLDEDSPWLAHAAEAFRGVFDEEPKIDKWTFSTNGICTAGMYDIPTLGLGPGDEVWAHAPNENCPIEHLSRAAAFYAALVARLGGKE